MPNMIIVVMPDHARFHAVLDAWEKYGVAGVTILESLGLHKVRQMGNQRDDLPLMPSLRHLLESEEYHHRTAFTVVDDDVDLDKLVQVTQRAIGGDFSAPNSGLLFIVPVARAYGLHPHWKS